MTKQNKNFFTGKEYQGKNALITSLSGFKKNEWAGFNQWKKNGYKVKKGSKGTRIQVVFNKKDSEGKGVTTKAIFNIEQVEKVT